MLLTVNITACVTKLFRDINAAADVVFVWFLAGKPQKKTGRAFREVQGARARTSVPR